MSSASTEYVLKIALTASRNMLWLMQSGEIHKGYSTEYYSDMILYISIMKFNENYPDKMFQI